MRRSGEIEREKQKREREKERGEIDRERVREREREMERFLERDHKNGGRQWREKIKRWKIRKISPDPSLRHVLDLFVSYFGPDPKSISDCWQTHGVSNRWPFDHKHVCISSRMFLSSAMPSSQSRSLGCAPPCSMRALYLKTPTFLFFRVWPLSSS